MDRDALIERVRELRAGGAPPKAIARAVGLTPAQVAPLIKAIAEERTRVPIAERPVVGCWVSAGWDAGLSFDGHPDWPLDEVSFVNEGLINVTVFRGDERARVSCCSYLVDTFCLGVKNTIGPETMSDHAVDRFVDRVYDASNSLPVAAPLELAQHLVFGAVEYARRLGFEPHPDFADTVEHLGEWKPPSAITFGKNGRPLFVQGPYDNPHRIVKTLERSVGAGNFDSVIRGQF